jgi:hypothetical protein
VQVPGLEPLQVWQSPQEVDLQQTPSTHVPLAQGASAEQWSPNPPPLLHMVPSQTDPSAQSEGTEPTEQDILHPVDVQA